VGHATDAGGALDDAGAALEEAHGLLAELAGLLDGLVGNAPGRGHARAVLASTLAWLELLDGDDAAGLDHLVEGYAAGVESQDMPILASVGVTVATALLAVRRPGEAAEVLGAAARLRGADDLTDVDVAWITAALQEELGGEGFAEAFARGRGLESAAAVERLDPAPSLGGSRRLRAAPVRP
jgi:hypothetical protein